MNLPVGTERLVQSFRLFKTIWINKIGQKTHAEEFPQGADYLLHRTGSVYVEMESQLCQIDLITSNCRLAYQPLIGADTEALYTHTHSHTHTHVHTHTHSDTYWDDN